MLERILDFLGKATPVAALIGVGYLSETGADGGFIKEIWAGLKTASPPVAMVMFFLYLRADTERREAQRQCNERTVDFVNSTNGAVGTFDKILSRVMPPARARRRAR